MTWPLDDIALWQAKYNRNRTMFVRGAISYPEATEALKTLRFRDEALAIELLEWERAKAQRRYRRENLAHYKLRRHFESRRVTIPSSV